MPKTAVIPTEFPGNIQLEPNEIHFIRPCRTVQKKILRLTNTSEKKIGWAIWTSSEKRMKVEPPAAPNLKFPGKIPDLNRTRQPYGTLLPGKTVDIDVYIDIVGDNEDVSQDRLTIEWGNAPDPTKRPNATFKHDWFMGRAKTRHEVIKIAYDSVQTD